MYEKSCSNARNVVSFGDFKDPEKELKFKISKTSKRLYTFRDDSYLLVEKQLRELHVNQLVEEVVRGLMCAMLPLKLLEKV